MQSSSFSKIIERDSKTLNVRDDLKGKSVEEIRDIQQSNLKPFALILLNVTGELNIGMMIRTATIFSCSEVHVIGRRRFDRRSTVGAEFYCNVYRHDALKDDLTIDASIYKNIINQNNFRPIYFETDGIPLSEVNWKEEHRLATKNNGKVVLVFGNEGNGIQKDILGYGSDIIVSIPQTGVLRSLNVSAAAAIAMYDLVSRI